VRSPLTCLAKPRATHLRDGVWWRTDRLQAFATARRRGLLLDANVDAFERAGRHMYLEQADALASYLLEQLLGGEVPTAGTNPIKDAACFARATSPPTCPIRPKEIFDGATPSAHAVGTRANSPDSPSAVAIDSWLFVAERLVDLGAPLLEQHPSCRRGPRACGRYVTRASRW